MLYEHINFELFKDFTRSDKYTARLSNWMKCSQDIYLIMIMALE